MTIEVFKPDVEIKDALPITMTDAAIAYVRKQLKKQGSGIGLRLRIKTTGCSGKSYKPEIATSLEENEISFSVAEDILVVVNKNDFLLYLKGLRIDFQQQGLNSSFKYSNPNEKGTCGCGESFTITNN